MGRIRLQSFQTLPFPQPCYPTGWWSCTMAKKTANAGFNFRIDDARSKGFCHPVLHRRPAHGCIKPATVCGKALAG